MITIKFLGNLGEIVGKKETHLQVDESVSEALKDICKGLNISPRDLSSCWLLINERQLVLCENTRLCHGDVLTFIPIVGSG